MEVIATEDSIEFSFAKIWGYTKRPWKITGRYRGFSALEKNNFWSDAKIGQPKCEFTKEAKDYLAMHPQDYFNMPEHRYTTLARQFRQDNNIPEIPEYQDLPEEKIIELCEKADRIEFGNVDSKTASYKYRYRKNSKKLVQECARVYYQFKDLERQRKNGVPEDQLQYRTNEEIQADYYEKIKQIGRERDAKDPKLAKRIRDNILYAHEYVEVHNDD